MQNKSPKTERELKELSLLSEITRIMDRSTDIPNIVRPVLAEMAKQLNMLCGTLTLLNRNTGEIFIEEAYGLTSNQKKRGRYKMGEGITGKVMQTGKTEIVPNISEDANFLNRTGVRNLFPDMEISFICVPIKIGKEVIGALSAYRLLSESLSLEKDAELVSIIALMIAQAVNIRQELQQERQQLLEENARLKEELDRFRPLNILGNSEAMKKMYTFVAKVSKSSNTTVLIQGETGTGKELVANEIHQNSDRAGKSFIKTSCTDFSEGVLESELFGHEKGAFTGALKQKKGVFERANGGTLFLDEIGDLPMHTQTKLLRVLQEQEFTRVGGEDSIKVDVRLITATNQDLSESVKKGKFREDLYYRLNVFPIYLPPLRERKGDIPLLANYFIEQYNKTGKNKIRRVSRQANDMLMNYHWPGNVRELESCIERAAILSNDGVIHGHNLPPTLQTAEADNPALGNSLQNALDAVEKKILIEALKSTTGRKNKSAQILQISERQLNLRLEKYGIDFKAFRNLNYSSTNNYT